MANSNEEAPPEEAIRKLVKLSSQYKQSALQRQTPGMTGQWRDYQFSRVNDRMHKAEFWVVLDGVREVETAEISSGKVILICQEPPDIKNYHPGFLAQFDAVYACHKDFQHNNLKLQQQGLPWLAGLVGKRGPADHYDAETSLDYDDFAAMPRPPKPMDISVLVSKISKARGHRQRQKFVEMIADQIPKLDVFGRGRKPLEDKKDAILPYRFHIVLENSAIDHYWTEKLADAYLCHAYPIYWGAPNLSSYFPEGSFLQIDLRDTQHAIEAIRGLLRRGLSETQLNALQQARSLVLNNFNTYAVMADACDNVVTGRSRMRTIKPEGVFPGFRVRQAAQRASRWTKAQLPMFW